MNMLSFSAFALTRAEMKNVIGGGTCAVCSHKTSTGSRICGGATLSKSQAKSEASSNNASSGGSGYSYTYCCQSC